MIDKTWGVDIPTRISRTENMEELTELMCWCGSAVDGWDILCALERAHTFGAEGK
jgi:hypothetical protein